MPLSSASSRYPGGTGAAISSPASYQGTFIPEIWSGKLLTKFYDATVLAAIANTDYEGELRNQGDRVKIRQRPTINISPYQPDGELTIQRPNAPIVEFTIDYADVFSFVLDDVWEYQSDMDLLSMWAEDAVQGLKVTVDTRVLSTVMLGAADAQNRGTTAGRISGNVNLGVTTSPLTVVPRNPSGSQVEIIDLIIRLGQVLDEQNVPETGRWLLISPAMAAMIKRSDLRDASLAGDGTSIMRNGRLGAIDRFTLYSSNLLPAGVSGGLAAGERVIYAGHNSALTFASQLTKMETLVSERTFGTVVRGLQVWGASVIYNRALAQAIITGV
jgi:hypothetical protein